MNLLKWNRILFPLSFLIITLVSLYFVKWNPYYAKIFVVAAKGMMGPSIISDQGVLPPPGWQGALSYSLMYFSAVWKAALVGILLGSLVQVLIPRLWVAKFMGDASPKSLFAALISSLPGMMCTCCAAPVAVGLRKAGASLGAATAFFLGNPVLNPATLIFMGFVLGWDWAVFRFVAGLAMVLFCASVIGYCFKDRPAVSAKLMRVEEESGFWLVDWMKALKELIWDTIPPYLVVVFVLGAIRGWLFSDIQAAHEITLASLTLLALVGTLFVIPTAAEIPVVQGLLLLGVGIAPSMTLLMTLPAVSLVSLLLVRRVFPVKALVFMYAAVAIIGVMSGLVGSQIL